jgi:deazaflavin-dependent oxidoreductase (nitroreductase family)
VRFNDQVIVGFRANAGRVGGELAETPIVLIHDVGARSGTEYVTSVAYQPLRGGLVVVGSNGGSPAEPDRCRNLRAHPRIDVEVATETFTTRARELADVAGSEGLPALAAAAQPLGEYQSKAARRFPALLLLRDSEAGPT